jgi:hypothetical protein
MQQLTDERLTLFLAKMFDSQEKNLLKRAERSTIPGAVQYSRHEDDLWFLETRIGTLWNGTSTVVVYQGEDKSKLVPVWRMSADRWVDEEALASIDGMSRDIVMTFLNDARRVGFERAANIITRLNPGLEPKDKLPFSIFDIPKQKQPVRNKYNVAIGELVYEEGIEDTLERFGGAEEIKFLPTTMGRKSVKLILTFVQGGRL